MVTTLQRPNEAPEFWFCRCRRCKKAYLVRRPKGTAVEQYVGHAICPDPSCRGFLVRTRRIGNETPTSISGEQAGL